MLILRLERMYGIVNNNYNLLSNYNSHAQMAENLIFENKQKMINDSVINK